MDTSQGSVRVIRITPDGPANKEGLQVGDLLLEIDGVSVYDLPLNQIMRAIRGKVGTAVELVRLFFFCPRSRVPGTGFYCLFHVHYSTTRENEQILYCYAENCKRCRARYTAHQKSSYRSSTRHPDWQSEKTRFVNK